MLEDIWIVYVCTDLVNWPSAESYLEPRVFDATDPEMETYIKEHKKNGSLVTTTFLSNRVIAPLREYFARQA